MNRKDPTFEQFDDWLETSGRSFRYPPMPSVAAEVAARVRLEPAPPSRSWLSLLAGTHLRGAVAAVIVAVLGFGLVIAISPSARTAVASFFGLGRIEVIRVDATPAPGAQKNRDRIAGLTSLAKAQDQAAFTILTPTYLAGLPDSATVYFQDLEPGQQVVLVYGVSPARSVDSPDDDLLHLTLFQFKTKGFFRKVVFPSTLIDELTVSGSKALWFEGTEHELQYVGPDGRSRTEFERTVRGNTLAWEVGEITYRLETSLPKSEAIRIAESLR